MSKDLRIYAFIFIFIVILCGCAVEPQPQLTVPVEEKIEILPTPTPTLSPPGTMLSICVGEEPASLFFYGNTSPTAQAIRQAIYDGPVDKVNFKVEPVILTKIPFQANGGVTILPIEVQPGTEIVDLDGNLTYLVPGTQYRPSGCLSSECSQTYKGDGSVTVDQVVIRFKLRDNLHWSDGTPLTAEDSVYSYTLAKTLFSEFLPDTLRFTQAYWALDDRQIEWRGIPGYQGISAYTDYFFMPLPKHDWSSYTINELFTSPGTTQKPLGWGPYVLDEWKTGDHISLHKNPYYFKAEENFPYFDHLSFRFVENGQEAIAAFLGRECDVVGGVDGLINELDVLQEFERAGELRIIFQEALAWEQAAFGVNSLDPLTGNLFQERKTRQAIAKCVDREAVAWGMGGGGEVANGYYPSGHPLNEFGRVYDFAPQEAAQMLEEVGWVDDDENPATPRLAVEVPGVVDGTPLAFTYFVAGDTIPKTANIIRDSLAQCGIQVKLEAQSAETLLAPGPEGSVFGRQFEMAQFAWDFGGENLCNLFTSSEIPGAYPEHSKGWGGGNATGYSNPDFDAACNIAQTSPPDSEETSQANQDALAIFIEDVPVLPLYFQRDVVLVRPEIQGLENGTFPLFWNLETYFRVFE